MFKEKFIQLCAERNESPSSVCKKIGISAAAFSQWNERTVPRKITQQKIADYFGVPVRVLLDDGTASLLPAVGVSGSRLTDREQALIFAYRAQPDMQNAVDKLLGVVNENGVYLYAAARSVDDHPDGIQQKGKGDWGKIERTPPTDDPLL